MQRTVTPVSTENGASPFARSRIRYYDGASLLGPLPWGDVDVLALPFERYELSFTPGLLAKLYGTRVTEEMLKEGGYVRLDDALVMQGVTPILCYDPLDRLIQTDLPTRYQLGNHLGSAMLELDDAGLVISYEEYHPYGSTAYHAVASGVEVSAKRYRYTGKERDEETGLYYYGARYYAAWLGRWTSADPAGLEDGPNPYAYVRGNPIRFHDPTGAVVPDVPNPLWNAPTRRSRNHRRRRARAVVSRGGVRLPSRQKPKTKGQKAKVPEPEGVVGSRVRGCPGHC